MLSDRYEARDALRELIHEKVREGRQYQWWIDLEDHIGEILDVLHIDGTETEPQ